MEQRSRDFTCSCAEHHTFTIFFIKKTSWTIDHVRLAEPDECMLNCLNRYKRDIKKFGEKIIDTLNHECLH